MPLRPSLSLPTEMIATNTKMMGMGPILIKFIITIPIFLFTGNAWESSTLIILIVIGQCFRVLRYTAAYFVRDDCMLESGGGNLKLESEQAAGAPASEQDASAPEGSPSSSEAEAAAKQQEQVTADLEATNSSLSELSEDEIREQEQRKTKSTHRKTETRYTQRQRNTLLETKKPST